MNKENIITIEVPVPTLLDYCLNETGGIFVELEYPGERIHTIVDKVRHIDDRILLIKNSDQGDKVYEIAKAICKVPTYASE